jgi:hypothetical protein
MRAMRLPSVAGALSVFGLLGTLIMSPTRAEASLVLALDLPTMVTRADRVAVVDVVSVKSDWDARHEQILSTIDLMVVESWKGGDAPASHLTIVQPGGTVGDLTQTVHGITRFVPGERAVVFLAGRAERGSVVGMAQGKRLVRRDAASGKMFVNTPDRAGATFIRTTPASATAPVFEMRARPLDELRADVRNLVANPGTVKPTPIKPDPTLRTAPGSKTGTPTGGAR